MKKYAFSIIWFFISCETFILEPPPKSSPYDILEEYTTLLKEKYAMLEYKGVNIDNLKSRVKSSLTGRETEEELLRKIGLITSSLKDGHSYLLLANKSAGIGYNIKNGYPTVFSDKNLGITYWKGLENLKINSKNSIRYGVLAQENNIGYIFIESFRGDISKTDMEKIFKAVSHTRGLIIDIRQNGGGNPELAYKFATYLTKRRIYLGYENMKSGKGSNDFVKSHIYLEPSGSQYTYVKPVYMITDRGSYSASLTLLYCTDRLPHVYRLGQRAGGGSGATADGFLANGWIYQISVSEFIQANGNHLDDGMDPDIEVKYDPNNLWDNFISRAIFEIKLQPTPLL